MKAWGKWPLVRAHLCTLAVSVSLNCTWRAPREGFRYGGLPFAIVLTAATLVSLPLVLLQLAVGQLSQQDAVGVWKAVPFFKGVGYLRLLVSFVGCVYSVVHVALTITYFLYTISNGIPFDECTDLQIIENGTIANVFNASDCLSSTFMSPVNRNLEHYMSMSLIILFVWIALPFLLFNPVKMMKRIFYVLGPLVVICGVVVASAIGSSERLATFYDAGDWGHFLQPYVWLAAVTQAFLTTQVAGGYLISAGDSIYSSNNVQWTATAFVCSNIAGSWCSLLFWSGVTGGADADRSSAAVLSQMYRAADEGNLPMVWPVLVFATLVLSGVITMLTFLYPVYDRVRRSGGVRWRAACALLSALGAGASLGALAGHEAALAALEDTAITLLVCVATVIELLAFVFIYGWKTLKEDVEFLTGEDLSGCCVVGWWATSCVVVPLVVWWAAAVTLAGVGQLEGPPWLSSTSAAISLAAAALLALVLVLAFAAVAVARQVQYDIIGKLKSSFQPSRHWGPRDPITHYYWLARREEAGREGAGGASGAPRTRYQRRRVGQLSGAPSVLNISPGDDLSKDISEVKRRSNSDDWIYTVCRRNYLEQTFAHYFDKGKRSVSLEWGKFPRVKRDSMKLNILNSVHLNPVESVESVSKDSDSVKNTVC